MNYLPKDLQWQVAFFFRFEELQYLFPQEIDNDLFWKSKFRYFDSGTKL